jgi:hypothetical protein
MSGCEQTSEFGQHEYRTGSGNERVVLRFSKTKRRNTTLPLPVLYSCRDDGSAHRS